MSDTEREALSEQQAAPAAQEPPVEEPQGLPEQEPTQEFPEYFGSELPESFNDGIGEDVLMDLGEEQQADQQPEIAQEPLQGAEPEVKPEQQPEVGAETEAEPTGEISESEELFGSESKEDTGTEAEPQTANEEKLEDPSQHEAAMAEGDSVMEQDSTSTSPEANVTVKEEKKDFTDPKLVVPQTHEIVIPSYSKWFNLSKIHEIEIKSLPEFFTNRIPSKTPQVYVKYRNFMVNSYRLNPNEYFTVTAARRNLCGDAGALFRLHKFLTKWGLINYQVNAAKKPKTVEPPFTGEFETRYDAPRGLFPFQSYKPALQLPDMTRLKKIMTQLDVPSNPPQKRSSDTMANGGNKESISASGGNIAHINGKDPSSEPKDEEGNNKDQPEGKEQNEVSTQENDRKPKRPKISQYINKEWTQEEVAKLIDSIKEHGTDWFTIAKSIGNKTPEQCILRFLQLPIEDSFLMDEKDLGLLKFGSHIPFNKSDNPVMSTLAFLIGLVDPKIVQQLTNRAITLQEDKLKSESTITNVRPTTTELPAEEKDIIGAQKKDFETSVHEQPEAIEEKGDEAPDVDMENEPIEEANTVQKPEKPEPPVPVNSGEPLQTDSKASAIENSSPRNEHSQDVELEQQEDEQKQGEIENRSEGSPEKDKTPQLETSNVEKTETSQAVVAENEGKHDTSMISESPSKAKFTVKDATEIALSTVGLRSHIFATNQERLMNKTTNELISTQLSKIDLKLKTLDTMEKSVELERKAVHKRQEDLFIQRLSLAKYATSLMEKFENVLKQIPNTPELKEQLEEIQKMIVDPPKTSIISKASDLQDADERDSNIKPVSVESPQLYRYWSG